MDRFICLLDHTGLLSVSHAANATRLERERYAPGAHDVRVYDDDDDEDACDDEKEDMKK